MLRQGAQWLRGQKQTNHIMLRRSSLTKLLASTSRTYFRLYLTTILFELFEGKNGRRHYVMMNLHKCKGRDRIQLAIPGSAVGLATHCAMGPVCKVAKCTILSMEWRDKCLNSKGKYMYIMVRTCNKPIELFL